ncbi:amylo-alpha-1,6-glucosidase [Propylenella binzhouense]|uniref:Glycogen debranching protein n=1 Tax=Propylenella binzhouense TaxID=2555902 RepID=A0A964T147_9HYPH|nr:amylo-alpha-1,6-glucosidase [Propylenella binzhouense]MYZ46496.1 glycogen debranching protein [Propylenella binzhouense]
MSNPDPIRIIEGADLGRASDREYLVANGLGGYSSAGLLGEITRRYHGLLVSALPAPYGRTVVLTTLAEQLQLPDGRRVELGRAEGGCLPSTFRLELGLPVWRYEIGDVVVTKRIGMRHLQNTVDVLYDLEGPAGCRLLLRPWLGSRPIEGAVESTRRAVPVLRALGSLYEIETQDDIPPLRIRLLGREAVFELEGGESAEFRYTVEAERGHASIGTLWSPGILSAAPDAGQVAFCASTDPWHAVLALSGRDSLGFERQRRRHLITIADPVLHEGLAAELVLAADSFVIDPVGRLADKARARAEGDEARTVIAGYHWFTDWGRDTMISLEGLTLATGRHREAGCILRTFAHYIRDGLIPNMFPEGETQGLYHTADATLWLFHALERYLRITGDWSTLEAVLPKLEGILDRHLHGTRFGIGVDPEDGLLRQGEEGYQLTWMDAKVEDWVVTPRRGKAVEINALWYNALCLTEDWLRRAGEFDRADGLKAHAQRTREAFNRRFWSDALGHLYDVVDGEDGDDPACRPNQIFAIALPHPVLDEERWRPVFATVRDRLLTPFGLRSLDRANKDYKPRYFGDLRARDAAYHQGTVWGWLIGPYVDAWLRIDPAAAPEVRDLLMAYSSHLSEAGVGTISEIFDGDPPFTPRGCISQAWSVAEWLRAWAKASKPPA